VKRCLAAFVLSLLPVVAHAQEPPFLLAREAGEHLRHGDPAGALRLFSDGDRPWRPDELALQATALLRLGRPNDARRAVQACAQKKDPDPRCVVALCEIERLAGSGPARLAAAMGGLRHMPGHVELTVVAGEQLFDMGKDTQARRLLDTLVDRYEQGEFKAPENLVAVARALQWMRYHKDANRVLSEAAEAVQEEAEAIAVERAYGELFKDKYNWRDADKAFRRVLAVDPWDATAVVGMARIDVASDHDIAKARQRLDALLKRNPQQLEALVARAEIALQDEDWPGARGFLDRAKKVRADWPRLLHVEGAWAKLADDKPAWQAAEKAVKKLNSGDGKLYLEAAIWLEQAHRYREVLELLKLALDREPDLSAAHAALGMGWARIGDDGKALEHLTQAWRGDPFDVRTANQLNVLYDGVLKQMVTLPGPKVDLRVHRRERKALERQLLPFLQKTLADLEERYGMQAEKPLTVEVFPATDQFSVRTVGLPQLGAHAVCFGHLITSRSPGEKPFNWKMVLRHELAHVFHIRMTDGRVPRWLTEGIAMMESAWADPRWQIRMDRRAYERWQRGELAKIDSFNLAFSQAKSMRQIVDAYYQSMLLAEFLSQTHGFDKLKALVAGHVEGAQTADVVRKVLGVAPAEVDRQFEAWLGTRLGRYRSELGVNVADLARELGVPADDGERDDGDPDDNEPAAIAQPATATAVQGPKADSVRGALAGAVFALRRGDGPHAWTLLNSGVAQFGSRKLDGEAERKDLCRLRALLLELAAGKGDKATAKAQELALAAETGCDSVKTRVLLHELAASDGDAAGAVGHLRAAWAMDPTDAGLGQLWFDVVGKAAATPNNLWRLALSPKNDAAEVRAPLLWTLQVEPNDPRPPALLAELAWQTWQASKDEAVRKAAKDDLLRAAAALEECDPAGRAAVLWEARSAVAKGDDAGALHVYRMAAERGKTPAERKEAWCELADAAARAKRVDEAGEGKRKCEADGLGMPP
jgi:tetratricopeptide (TPR) repeat protein